MLLQYINRYLTPKKPPKPPNNPKNRPKPSLVGSRLTICPFEYKQSTFAENHNFREALCSKRVDCAPYVDTFTK